MLVNLCFRKTTKASYRPTPYGGKIAWTLPGVRETALTAHLKDKTKIRNKKRWSQVCRPNLFTLLDACNTGKLVCLGLSN